jgi:Tfp pilus assembly protein PilV
MFGKQKVAGSDTPAPRRSRAWLEVVVVGAVAMVLLVVGALQAAKTAASVASEQPASSAVIVSPIDHSVVRSIDANAEPDSTGASIAVYGP